MQPEHAAPPDADDRRAVAPVTVYTADVLPPVDLPALRAARAGATRGADVLVPPRDARAFRVRAGDFFRIVCTEGAQVGDLNLWNAATLGERFFSGKTRALHGTHVTTGDRLWSSLPHLRPMATITGDSLDWYGADRWGCRVHDVIGTRCDPYTNRLLTGGDYHHCCHSNLTRALAEATGLPLAAAEPHVHDVLNVFMCTGFDRADGRYIMKASPARPGDALEFFAEIDLLGALSACPGGDCGSGHSSDAAPCHPLRVEVWRPAAPPVGWSPPSRNAYAGLR
jgi:uncharacterized protein